MRLYHGSNIAVEKPRIIPSDRKLDFGTGFYLTTNYEQAAKWALLTTKRREIGKPTISVYEVSQKYGLEPMNALRKFLLSETYQMLINQELEMWDFGPLGIFDMWESEQITGNPRNSLYLRRDEYV